MDYPFGITDWINLKENSFYGLAIGSKFHKDSLVERSIGRRIFSKIFQYLRYVTLNSKIKDTQGSLFISGTWYKDFLATYTCEGPIWSTALTQFCEANGIPIYEVPVIGRNDTKISNSSFKLIDGIKIIFDLFKLRNQQMKIDDLDSDNHTHKFEINNG
jgi:hypothetical protein